MIRLLKKILLWFVGIAGSEVRDARTGKILGKSLLLSGPWGLSAIGMPKAVRLIFLSEKTTRYSRHRIGFAKHEEPDYPSLKNWGTARPDTLLWAILVHHQPARIRELTNYWKSLGYGEEKILILHAGKDEDFKALDVPNKVFVPDPEIRTSSHPLEKQSYHGVFREASQWMRGRDFSTVCLVEYDHLPIVPDWGEKLCSFMERESADVLCHHLTRVDDTNASHYLYHLQDPRFRELWKSLSLREEKGVFLDAIMTGSLWKRAAFEAVAAHREPFPVYLELYLPSLAHHLGCRVRGYANQDAFVQVVPIKEPFSKNWIERGAWSLHQVKSLDGFAGKRL